jgi:hypothetical protein
VESSRTFIAGTVFLEALDRFESTYTFITWTPYFSSRMPSPTVHLLVGLTFNFPWAWSCSRVEFIVLFIYCKSITFLNNFHMSCLQGIWRGYLLHSL